MADIEGRALDEAVAKAMGWFEPVHPGRPDYSTDAAHIPEMVAHLRQFGHVTINVPSVGTVAVQMSFDDLDTFDVAADGATISEVLARLVVAVAEAKR